MNGSQSQQQPNHEDPHNFNRGPPPNRNLHQHAMIPSSSPTTKPSMSYFRMSRRSAEPDYADDSGALSDPLLEDDLESTLLIAHQQHQQQRQHQQQQHYAVDHGRLGWIRHTTSVLIRKLGNLLAAITFFAMLIGIPWVTYHALQNRRVDLAAVDSAGVMVLGTVILSTRLVYLHLSHWYMPDVQKYVVRILWMVPLYAVQSWLSLRFHHVRLYFDTARDLYEAYVIASFLYYLIELLGGQDNLVQMLQAKQTQQEQHHHLGQHGFPLSLVLEPWELGMEFMMQCKHGVLQYVVVKTISTFITFACESLGLYGEGQFSWTKVYPYLSFVLNVSVMYALYCLVKLFHAVNDELRYPRDWHPLGKFLAVKGVVFFTWWQGIIIFYLRAHGIISNVGAWTGDEVANGLIDYCICIEMVLFAICHYYVFTWKEYLPTSQLQPSSQQQQLQQQQQAPSQHYNHGLDDVVVDENDLESLLLLQDQFKPNQNSTAVVATKSNTTTTNHQMVAYSERRSAAAATAAAVAAADPSANATTSVEDDINNNSNKPPYKPPTVLSHPMKFRDALWSSTVPKETLHDLRRLRKGVDTVVQQTQAPGAIGLTDMSSSSSSNSSNTNIAAINVTRSPVPPTTLTFTSSTSSYSSVINNSAATVDTTAAVDNNNNNSNNNSIDVPTNINDVPTSASQPPPAVPDEHQS